VPRERGREPYRLDADQSERFEQFDQLALVQRPERHGHEAQHLFQRSAQGAARSAAFGRPLRVAPGEFGDGVAGKQGGEGGDARVVGEVQVVDDDALQAGARRLAERRCNRALQQHAACVARDGGRLAEFGQQQCELVTGRILESECDSREHRPHEAREQRIGHSGVAGLCAHQNDARIRAHEVVQHAGLADARFAEQREHAALLPGLCKARELGVAPDEMRRTHETRGHHRAAWQRRYGAALDRSEQLHGLGRRARPELVLQAALEGLERCDRRARVAAQVVQAQQAALGVLGERIGLREALRVRQSLRQVARCLARVGRVRERRVAARAPSGACRMHPACEFGQVLERHRAEDLVAPGVRIARHALEHGREIGLDARRQAQRGPAAHEARADVAAQAEQALAQVGVALAAIGLRPDQRRGAFGRHRAIERDDREQRRVLGRQAHHLAAAVGAREPRLAKQVQAPRDRRVDDGRGGSPHLDDVARRRWLHGATRRP
jgi:hypothetical protein